MSNKEPFRLMFQSYDKLPKDEKEFEYECMLIGLECRAEAIKELEQKLEEKEEIKSNLIRTSTGGLTRDM